MMEDIQDSATHSKQNKWEPDSNTDTALAAGDMKSKTNEHYSNNIIITTEDVCVHFLICISIFKISIRWPNIWFVKEVCQVFHRCVIILFLQSGTITVWHTKK